MHRASLFYALTPSSAEIPIRQLQVVDSYGGACAFINSNYARFGTGIAPRGCGFSLQNRGAGFSTDPRHPNAAGPGRRPYHTLVPGMATVDASGELWASFSNMGGFMQPQGHVQLIVALADLGLDAQASVRRVLLATDPGLDAQASVKLLYFHGLLTSRCAWYLLAPQHDSFTCIREHATMLSCPSQPPAPHESRRPWTPRGSVSCVDPPIALCT